MTTLNEWFYDMFLPFFREMLSGTNLMLAFLWDTRILGVNLIEVGITGIVVTFFVYKMGLDE